MQQKEGRPRTKQRTMVEGMMKDDREEERMNCLD
jgi:hypothetical protein